MGEYLTMQQIWHTHFKIGDIIQAAYLTVSLSGKHAQKYRDYVIIQEFPEYVLCERRFEGGSYLKCFHKVDIMFGHTPREEYGD